MTFQGRSPRSSCLRSTTGRQPAAGTYEAAPKASPPPQLQPLGVRVTEPPRSAWTASDRHRRLTPGSRSGDGHLNPLGRTPRRRSPSSARQPAGSSRAAAATERAAAGPRRQRQRRAGSEPWPGLAPGTEPGRAGPPAGCRHPQEDPLGRREKARARSRRSRQEGAIPGSRLRDPGGALGRSDPGVSGQVGPGGIWTDRSRRIRGAWKAQARELGEAGRGGRASGGSSVCTVIQRSPAG